MEVGKREIIYLSLYCYHHNDSCNKMASIESHFNASLSYEGQSHMTVSTNHTLFEEKGSQSRTKPRPCCLPANACCKNSAVQWIWKLSGLGQLKNDAETLFPPSSITFPPVNFANATVVAFVLLLSCRLSFSLLHTVCPLLYTPSQKSARKWQLQPFTTFMCKRLQRAFTHANQLCWTAQYRASWYLAYLPPNLVIAAQYDLRKSDAAVAVVWGRHFVFFQCWETYVGQQFYKLAIVDFAALVVITFFVEFPRKWVPAVHFFQTAYHCGLILIYCWYLHWLTDVCVLILGFLLLFFRGGGWGRN